jgi:hypothetical protein
MIRGFTLFTLTSVTSSICDTCVSLSFFKVQFDKFDVVDFNSVPFHPVPSRSVALAEGLTPIPVDLVNQEVEIKLET